MPQKSIIFSTGLRKYRPIIWYGEPVFARAAQINSILKNSLGDDFAYFFAEPIIDQEKLQGSGQAHWMSEYVENPVALTTLPTNRQQELKSVIAAKIKKIKSFAQELQQKDDQNSRELGEVLLHAIEVPSMDFVMVDGDKVTLVLWGFNSDEAQKVNFKLSHEVEKAEITTPPPPPLPPVDIVKPEDTPPPTDNNITTNNVETKETPPDNKNTDKKRKGLPAWLWLIIGVLLGALIFFLIWWFFLRNESYLPPDHAVVPPIDTTQIGEDPDDPVHRKIFTDKFNVALVKNGDIEAFSQKVMAKYKDDIEIAYYDTVIKLMQFKTPEGEWKSWMDSIRKFPEARLVFSEAVFDHSKKPSDPGFSDNKQSWYFNTIQAYNAWENTSGSDEVVVAVIDNGFDLSHPEFDGKIVNPWNIMDNSPNVRPVGENGSEHGTHVAGSAVGLADNAAGVSGIAPNCKLMPIQVGDANGSMTSLGIVGAVLYAIHKEADIVNMSLGMIFPPEVAAMPIAEQEQMAETLYSDEAAFWDELYLFAVENDILIIRAAGNNDIVTGIDPGTRSCNILLVAAIDPNIERAGFSNFGKMTGISAPGVEIFSSVPNKGYSFLQGTSMASPIVAGAAALIKSENKNITPYQIIYSLIKSAKILKTDKYVGPYLQIENALKIAKDAPTIDDCEKLKQISGDSSSMVIPDNPTDLEFAEGRWKSSSDLVKISDNQKIELFFDIKKEGTGKLTLVETDGTECFADIQLSYNDNALLIEQLEPAQCNNGKGYRPYVFKCKQGRNNVANCTAEEQTGSGPLIEFTLIKVE